MPRVLFSGSKKDLNKDVKIGRNWIMKKHSCLKLRKNVDLSNVSDSKFWIYESLYIFADLQTFQVSK